MALPYVAIKGDRFLVDMMYARPNNMSGRAVYQELGWGNLAVVHIDLWQRLKKLEPVLAQKRLKLKICDAYRPKEAHLLMKQIVPMKGFFAETPEKSQHCLGTAVDVCLCTEEGIELKYPTKVDAYDEVLAKQVQRGEVTAFMAHLQKARHDYEGAGMQIETVHRQALRQMMEAAGLEAITHEWWHYNLPNGKVDRYPLVDLRVEDF